MKKKFLKGLFSIVLGFALTLPLAACNPSVTSYHTDAGKMDELKGTYKLTTYTKKDSNNEKYDAKQTNEMESYLVVGSDGYGYYTYKDKTTDFSCETTIIQYNYETDSTELIKSIRFADGLGKKENMGFTSSNHTLTQTVSGNDYSYTEYTRISTDTDLSKVRTELGKDTTTLPEPAKFAIKNLSQFMYFDYNNSTSPNTLQYEQVVIDNPTILTNMTYSKYNYIVADFGSLDSNNEFNVYYKEGTDEKTAKGTISFKSVPTNIDQGFTIAEITILGTTYKLGVLSTAPLTTFNYELYTDPDANGTSTQIYSEKFAKYTATDLLQANDADSAKAIGNYYSKPTV